MLGLKVYLPFLSPSPSSLACSPVVPALKDLGTKDSFPGHSAIPDPVVCAPVGPHRLHVEGTFPGDLRHPGQTDSF